MRYWMTGSASPLVASSRDLHGEPVDRVVVVVLGWGHGTEWQVAPRRRLGLLELERDLANSRSVLGERAYRRASRATVAHGHGGRCSSDWAKRR